MSFFIEMAIIEILTHVLNVKLNIIYLIESIPLLDNHDYIISQFTK